MRAVLRALSSFSTGRRSKWVVIALWVVLGFALFSFQPKLQDATTNENEAFLPESAESTEVNDLLSDRFADGREVDALIAYNREGGLTADDQERIADDALAIAGVEPGATPDPSAPCSNPELVGALAVVDPFAGPVCGADKLGGGGEAAPGRRAQDRPVVTDEQGEPAGPPSASPDPTQGEGPPTVSEDGSTALLLVRTNTEDSDEIQDNVDVLREIAPEPNAPDGELRAYVTGIAGIVADSIEVFESIDVTLLAVTVSLVLVLLLAIYRSPIVALVPLFTVAIAYGIAAAAVYGLVEAGVFEVNGQTTSLLIVLMFGAGTDYCLLIVARYREELRRFEDKHEAMAHAAERTGPPILSAGGTVVVAMLVLILADLKSTQTMGPVLALGVAIMLLAGLTLLPALLAALGRRAFWPAIPRVGSEQRRPLDIWRRIGHLVHDRPVAALSVTVLVLALGSLGNLNDRGIIDFGEGFRDPPESVDGQLLIEDQLSGGQTAPTTVLVDADAAGPTAAALRSVEGVDAAFPSGTSEDGELARIDATLAYDPFSDQANDLVPGLRETVTAAAGGGTALVGGTTAENYDTSETLASDARLIVPLILGLIFLILCLLLRAVVAPLYLIATVVLSYAFALGATNLIITELFNQPDSDPGLPTFAFIFLVALGVDYNIFLISRIREEAAHEATKEAVITGLERTGGVITSAGVILAGTFLALMSLPLEALFQIGFTIAFGLLVDTFIVRTILVPAIAFKLGERNWWPSRIAHDVPQAPPAPRAPQAPGAG
jgi:RND superfamily putative drug exporter